MADVQGQTGKPTRVVRVQKLYLSESSPKGDVRASVESLIHTARLQFKENGQIIDINLDDLFDRYPNWARAAAAFGALTAAANAATSARSAETEGPPDLEDMIAACEDRVEEFGRGLWSSEAAGPRTNDFVTAYVQAREAAGVNVPEHLIEALREKLASKALTPAKMMKDQQVRAAYASIKAKRAAERAAKYQAAAEGVSHSSDLDDLITS